MGDNQLNEALRRQPGQCAEVGDLVTQFPYEEISQGLGEKPDRLGEDAWERAAEALSIMLRHAFGDGQRVTHKMIVRRIVALVWPAGSELLMADKANLRKVADHFRLNYKKLAEDTGKVRKVFGLRNSFQSAQKDEPGGKKRTLSRSGREGLDERDDFETKQRPYTQGGDIPLSLDEDSEEGEV